jgi:hypothetical protein
LEANEICAICDNMFADENELKGHVNEVHRKSTGPTKPNRSARPPNRLANQLFKEYETFAIKQEESIAKTVLNKREANHTYLITLLIYFPNLLPTLVIFLFSHLFCDIFHTYTVNDGQ